MPVPQPSWADINSEDRQRIMDKLEEEIFDRLPDDTRVTATARPAR